MSRFQSNHLSYQELGRSQTEQEKASTDANTDMTKMLEMYDKDLKTAILNMLQQGIMNMLEANLKIESWKEK